MSTITLTITDVHEQRVEVVSALAQSSEDAHQLSAYVAEALSTGIETYIKANFDDMLEAAQLACNLDVKHAATINAN